MALCAAAGGPARRQHPTDPQWRLLNRVQAIDSTFISLSATLSPWSQHKRANAGVRLQTSLDLLGRLPSRIRMTTTEINDHAALRQLDLTGWAGWTLLIDRGYYGHRQFVRLIEAGVHFVACCSEQAHFQVVRAHQPPAGLTPDGDEIYADAVVILGSANNRRGAVVPNLRLIGVRTRSGNQMKLVTDRHDLSATQVVRLYRKRWQIELFFRWLKRQLGAIRPLGQSQAAVQLTLVLAVAALLLLASARAGAAAALALLVAFSLALVRVRLRSGDRRVPCGCFGRRASVVVRLARVRNAVLAALGVLAFTGPQPDALPLGLPSFGEAVPAVLALVGIALGAWVAREVLRTRQPAASSPGGRSVVGSRP